MLFEPKRSLQIIVIIGPAGSGKTTLVKTLGEWIEKNQNINIAYINLDPGVEYLPYKPDIDAREYVTVYDVIKKYKLGPNGGLIKSIDLLIKYKDIMISRVKKLVENIVIVDTPGQMELFLFRETGPIFINSLSQIGTTIGVLVFDPTLTYRPSDVIALKLMNMVVDFRLGIENILVINKIDKLKDSKIIEMIDNPQFLQEYLHKEKGILAEVAEELAKVMDKYGLARRIAKISAKEGLGMDELYDLLHEIYCTCGDLT